MTDIAKICKLNNITEEEYLSQIVLNCLASMDMKLHKPDVWHLKITKGTASLLILRPEEQE